jgi:predicted ArsR family transcriptional regulator
LSIHQLTDELGVTQTAVRQRLSRLLALELIDRVDEKQGRGRPSHQYRLTEKGHQTVGNNLADLAGVLWEEIQLIPDVELKRLVMSRVVNRLAEKYADQFDGKSLSERMVAAAGMLGEREIPSALEHKNGMPVLKLLGCPYPELVDESKSICNMEKQLFEVLLDHSVEVDCQCGSHGQCCSFQLVESESTSGST